MRTSRSLLAVFWLALFALALACGEATRPEPAALASTPRPEDVVLELRVDDTASALSPIREAVGEANARLIPSTARGIADALVPLPRSIEDAVVEGPVRAVAFEGSSLAFVVLVRATESALALDDDGPFPGTHWVRGEAAATYRGRVVIAEERSDVERALPYLVTQASDAHVAGLTVEVLGPAVPALLRALGDPWIEERVREASASIEAERARHGGPPALGDPEAVLARLSQVATDALTFLPDVERALLALQRTAAGPDLTVSLSLRPGSPALSRLEGVRMDALGELVERLPASTAIAFASTADRTTRRARSRGAVELLAQLGGERLGPNERARLEAVLSSWDALRGDRGVYALSDLDGRPVYSFESDAGAPDEAGTGVLLPFGDELPYTRALAEAVLRCVPTPRASPIPLGLSGGSALSTICEATEYSVARTETALYAAIAPDLDDGAFAGNRARGAGLDTQLSSLPDVQRLLAAHAGPRLFLMLVFPDRLVAALRAIGGEPTPSPDSVAALAFSVATEGETGLQIRLSASPSGLGAMARWAGE